MIEGAKVENATPQLRLGMVGGGPGAFIGAVHMAAARLDNRYKLVAGCFSSDPLKSREIAPSYYVEPDRVYDSYKEMAAQEAKRKDGIEAVTVVTPNSLHHQICKTFLEAGIDVICDKPLTTTVDDAVDLVKTVKRTGRVFGLTHEYTGFAAVRQAREMVRKGELGKIRILQIEYPQEWLSTALEEAGLKQAVWRTNPKQSGMAAALADIGTHGIHAARYITGLEVTEVFADLTTFVPGRALEDNAHVLLRYDNGARGMLWASQCSPGAENDCRVRIVGEKGSLDWKLRWPNEMTFSPLDGNHQLISRGRGAMEPLAAAANRTPSGHPDGLHDAFAIIYRDVADAIVEKRYGIKADPLSSTYPTVEEGARMMKFIEACVESNKAGRWVSAELNL